ncbi:hypothetical protein GQ457_02G017140 [Hibiscus cannabinus]
MNDQMVKKYYVVFHGKKVGIYHSWIECAQMIIGVKGSRFESFESESDAKKALDKYQEKKVEAEAETDIKEFIVGNGNSIEFWSDILNGNVPFGVVFPRIFALAIQEYGFIFSCGWVDGGVWIWNIQLRRQLFDWELQVWDNFVARPPRRGYHSVLLLKLKHSCGIPTKVELFKRGNGVVHGVFKLYFQTIIKACFASGTLAFLVSMLIAESVWKMTWSLWLFRNEVIFKGKTMNVGQLLDPSATKMSWWCKANQH